MDFKFDISNLAEAELDGILDYIIYNLHNPTAARNLFRKMYEAIENVCLFPLSGAIVGNEFAPNKIYRRLMVDNYIVYYEILEEKKTIYILRIVYGQRNQENILA